MLLLPILLAAASSEFVGTAVCAECHAGIAARQRGTRHAEALRPVPATNLIAQFSANPLRERGGAEFLYEPASAGGALRAIVNLNGQRADMLLEWAFGAGAQGVTPVGRLANGRWVEHRISYYTRPARPSRTVGHPGASSTDAAAALGLVQDPATITRCFQCHATGVNPGPALDSMIPGVTCERCHGPGREHTAAARARQPAEELRRAVFNGGRLPAKASMEVCAGCHRLNPAGLVASSMPEVEDPVSIRFQPIGLAASRCFQKSGTLTCTTCHDPHENAATLARHYSQRCLSCHGAAHRRNEDCAACHMPRSSPLPYLEFTDHRIRVAR